MATTHSENLPAPLALFAVREGPRIDEELAVPSPKTSIGSGAQNDLVIQDDSISKSHALLEFAMGAWRITDLESTNGTFVEGVRLAPHVPTPLQYGASVRFGGLRVQFRAAEGSDPEAAQEAYVPPEPPTRVAERRPGFRLPLWIALLLLALVLAAGVAVFAWMQQSGEPAAAPAPVERTLPAAQSEPPAVTPAPPLDTGVVVAPAEGAAAPGAPDTAPDTAATGP